MRLASLPHRSLEALVHRVDQSLVGIADSVFYAVSAALFEPTKRLFPACLTLGIGDAYAQNRSVAHRVDPDDDQRAGRPHRALTPDFNVHRVDQDEGIFVRERPLAPRLDLLVEALAQVADRRLLEPMTAQFVGDVLDSTGRHAV